MHFSRHFLHFSCLFLHFPPLLFLFLTLFLDFPTGYASSFDDYLSKGLSTLSRFRDASPLLSFAMAPHAPYTVSDANLQLCWQKAQELNIPLHTHLHETVLETRDSEEGKDSMARHRSHELCRPLANFERLGICGPKLIAAHMTQLDASEIALMARTGSHVVHCPESNMKLVSGFCPVHKLLLAGGNVALGTDSACSNNNLSMFGEMQTAALVGKVQGDSAVAFKGMTALRLATVGGARAAGKDKVFGSLQVGMAADFIGVEYKGAAHQPIYKIATHITYNTEASQYVVKWGG